MQNASKRRRFEREKKSILNCSVNPKLVGSIGSLVRPLIPMVQGRFKGWPTQKCELDQNGG